MQPKVSIIIPCFRVERYLDRCVNSVRNQTLNDIEIILVDDGSPDRVPQMCDEWRVRDHRIKVIHKKNAGLGMACNSGLEVATGRYVAFLDSDDWVDKDMYQAMYSAAEEYGAQVVYTGLKRVYEDGLTTLLPHPSEFRICDNEEKVFQLMLDMISSSPSDIVERHIQVSAKVVLYSHDLLKKNNIRFESERQFLSEDLLFNLDTLNNTSCAVVLPQVYYNYYCNDSSITKTVKLDKQHSYEEFYYELCRRYPNLIHEIQYQLRIDKLIFGYLRIYMRVIVGNRYISSIQKRNILNEICHSPLWGIIACRYPLRSMPWFNRIIFGLINKKLIFPLYLVLLVLNRRKLK